MGPWHRERILRLPPGGQEQRESTARVRASLERFVLIAARSLIVERLGDLELVVDTPRSSCGLANEGYGRRQARVRRRAGAPVTRWGASRIDRAVELVDHHREGFRVERLCREPQVIFSTYCAAKETLLNSAWSVHDVGS